uniref:Reverse transcriptase domain-containing protein n=1 Tax=Tanacetum cinerariifolium TaxID=118510 RepID=A0A6L2N9D0_TANCI|nr:reverse transcriptase domain-containing protein [Tanacetum cinerariifolium]
MSAYSNDSRHQSYHSSRRDTESCYQSSRPRGTKPSSDKHLNKRESSHRTEALSESEGSAGGHWKSKSKKQRSSIEDDDLSRPWVYEETNSFTPCIRYFNLTKRTRMPSHVKTYDESKDLEDHIKIFQEARKVKRWAMPTWCHMLNSTLIGSAMVWFDDLPPKSVDSYDDLKVAFVANFPPPPMTTPIEKRNNNKFCELHGEVGHNTDECMHLKRQMEELLKNQKVSHVIKELKQNRGNDQPKANKKGEISSKDKALAILMKLGAILYTECMWMADQLQKYYMSIALTDSPPPQKIRNQMNPATSPLIGFSGEIIWPLGQLSLLAKIGDEEHSTSYWMNFVIVRSLSPYNGIIRRPRVRKIQAVPSTAHGMIKFSVAKGVLTLRSSKIILIECAIVSGPERQSPDAHQAIEEKIKEGCPPVRQKRRSQAANRNQTIHEEVEKLVDASIMKEVHYHNWLSNLPRFKRSGSELDINGKIGFSVGTRQQASKRIFPSTPNYSSHRSTHKASIIKTRSGRNATTIEYRVGRPILTNPKGTEFTYALRFRFEATNNEAEYKALITGLRIAEEMGVKNLQENVGSRLMANQVNGTYIAKEADMIRYLEKVKTFTSGFRAFLIKQFPISENKKADALSKIASSSFAHLSKQVLVKKLKEKSINVLEVLAVVEEERNTWMTSIYEYLAEETLSAEVNKARAVRRKSQRFTVINGVLYKKSFLRPWIWSVRPFQANYVLREIHEGSCSMHAYARSSVARALRTGYYWPIMHNDARALIRACQDCQMEEISHVLWAHYTMIKSSNGDTPFSLTYGTEAVIPAEIGMPILRTAEVDMVQNNEALGINLDLLEERREHAAICEAKSRAKMEKYYNSKVRNTSFKPGDLVYRNNDASRTEEVGKLGLKWEGPYEITEALGKGAYKLRDCDGKHLSRT